MNKVSPKFLTLKSQIIDACTVCNGQGWKVGSAGIQVPCSCMREMTAIAAIAKGNVPEEYWAFVLDSYPGDKVVKEQMKILLDCWRTTGDAKYLTLFMTGPYRRGKTSLAVSVAKAYVELNPDAIVRYITARELESVHFDSNNHRGIYEIAEVDFLIVDELGKEVTARNADPTKRAMRGVLDIIIRARRTSQPTIVISNLDLESIKKWYGNNLHIIFTNDFIAAYWTDESPQINLR